MNPISVRYGSTMVKNLDTHLGTLTKCICTHVLIIVLKGMTPAFEGLDLARALEPRCPIFYPVFSLKSSGVGGALP